jgi:hypothetical protein
VLPACGSIDLQPNEVQMARAVSIKSNQSECDTILTKALQSGHINFLLGSGASLPAIATAGDIETSLNDLLKKSDAKGFEERKLKFLEQLQTSTNALIAKSGDKSNEATLEQYRQFLSNLSRILDERKTELLPKQLTIFTTNYDLFVERAAEGILNLRINDGFSRNPAVCDSYTFQPEHYFDVTFKTGTLFKYRFPIPTVNLIKLHGSLSWRLSSGALRATAPHPEAGFCDTGQGHRGVRGQLLSRSADEREIFGDPSHESLLRPAADFRERSRSREHGIDLLRIFVQGRAYRGHRYESAQESDAACFDHVL